MAHRTLTSSFPLTLSDRLVAGLAALLVGSFLIYGAGLSHAQTLHDTAHDTRHSYGFPCH
ncbi:CbtB domain-containing protein [Pararhizobium mangrovi]|uniref:Cobalt transporter n=1 Tax=Pararhizobium mangrovi TaxID=2590452 RepID=A0A506U2C2_9HYPH|nr:CbtB-domain containing protein [Pararhizobium mangrovi]TPW27135.1 cobalt transporter [Pararhizobium mangrovi]